jgi:hypothetical protein
VGLYRQLYPLVEATVLDPLRSGAKLSVHGSEVRDHFISFLAGRADVDNRAEKLLRELVEEGVLVRDPIAAPTLSQAAFYSLQGVRMHPGWVPGCIEHFRYRLA